MTLYRISLHKAMEGTETVWTPLTSHKFESDVPPDKFTEAVDNLAEEARSFEERQPEPRH